MSALKLHVVSGTESGSVYQLTDGTLTIGRSRDAGWTLRDKKASRIHAEITVRNETATITDLGSSNGTLINGDPIAAETKLKAGDQITIAETVLMFAHEDSSRPRILCTDGPSEVGQQFELADGRTVIGRDGGSDIRLHHDSVASLQSAVNVQSGTLTLHDLNSPNGTYLNGDRISRPTALRSGDVISMGDFTFEVVDPEIDDLPNDFFNGFTLISRIGSGTISTTFKARYHKTDEVIALAIYPPSVIEETATKARLMNAGRQMSRLNHPNILPIIATGIQQDYLLVASALCTNGSLKDIIFDTELAPPEVIATICLDAARGLACAAESNTTHAGLKPSNILIDDVGVGMVGDFGLSAALDRSFSAGSEHPYYRSPEELDGKRPNHLSDQYALGAIAYHGLTGEPPFGGGDAATVAASIRGRRLVSILDYNKDVSRPLALVIAKMMSRDPRERYANWEEVCTDLQSVVEHGDNADINAGQTQTSSIDEATGVHRIANRSIRGRGAVSRKRQQRSSKHEVKQELQDIPPGVRSLLLYLFVFIGLLFAWIILKPILTR